MTSTTLQTEYATVLEVSNYYLISKRYLKKKLKSLKAIYKDLVFHDGYRNHIHNSLVDKLAKRTYTRTIRKRQYVEQYLTKVNEEKLYKRMAIYCTISPRGINKERFADFEHMLEDIFEHLTHEQDGSHFMIYSLESNSNYYTVGSRKKNVNHDCLHSHMVCTVPVENLEQLRDELNDIIKTYFTTAEEVGKHVCEYDERITLDLQRYDQKYMDVGQRYVLKGYKTPQEILTQLILK
jgi:hypothetical protein